jgi:hypothetical protein
VYVAWKDNSFEPFPDIYFTRSTDSGATFEPPEILSHPGEFEAQCTNSCVREQCLCGME